jgi:uncharacterized protein GlcG (DUF336 family)
MKTLVTLTLALCALCLGCRTTNPSGKIIASSAVTVDAAMKGWSVWVHDGKATEAQEVMVRDAFIKYKSIETAARKAYAAAYAAKDDSSMAQVVAALQAAVADLNLIVITFKTGGTL